MKDYIDSEKRCNQFRFSIKFNHLFSWGTERRWHVFAGSKEIVSIANKDQDHSCVEWQLHATWHFSDVHAKVFYIVAFSSDCNLTLEKDASQTFMLGHNWNSWRFSTSIGVSCPIQDVRVRIAQGCCSCLAVSIFKMSFSVPGDLCRDTEVFDHQYWDKRSGRLSWLIMWRAMRDLWTKGQGWMML